jgi:hypothetical protein
MERSRKLLENLRDSKSSGRQESGTAVDGKTYYEQRDNNDISGRTP